MKKSTKSFLFITTAALAAMYAYNRFVANTSAKKNMLPTKNGSYYSWKQGNVFYTKLGSGKPVLLIHDTNSASSSVEWSKITKRLQKNHCVYTMDLLGCGLSDKPGVSYTTYMYVQLITAFIHDVIKEKTDIVATNMSAPTTQSKLKKNIISLPIVGTFIYNLLMNPARMSSTFRNTYYYRSQMIPPAVEDAYYESAHMDNSNGKYLYASILGNYMGGNIRHAVKRIDKPVYIIASRGLNTTMKTIEEYRKLNTRFEVTSISNCRLYPQLENADKTFSIINAILSK